jgi:hypothetical protein
MSEQLLAEGRMNGGEHILFELLAFQIDGAIWLCAQNIGLLKLIVGETPTLRPPTFFFL